jgi:hypothetical protein
MFFRTLFRTVIVAALLSLAAASGQEPKLINGCEPKWWKESVVYQIYPRSFILTRQMLTTGTISGIIARS